MNQEIDKEKLFEEKYQILNSEQRKAVDILEGPVTVVAGPGTGKTQILTLRIANILKKQGADFAGNILALTFTDAGVKAMRNRLVDFIGPDLAYEVGIFTFHSFCSDQIKNFPEYFKRFSFSTPVSEIEKIDIADEILEQSDYKELKTFSSYTHNTYNILQAISELKSEGIAPDDFEKTLGDLEQRYIYSLGEDAFYKRATTIKGVKYEKGDLKPTVKEKAQKELEKSKELLDFYRKYQAALVERRLYDFDDMILRVVEEARENENFLRDLQEKYFYLLIDEHQDTNAAQNELVELIASAEVNEGRPNLFVVGDSKQAIYKFQGASIEEFEKIRKKYKDVKVINLKNNYRSSQEILDTAYELISQDEKLEAKNPEFAKISEKIKLLPFQDRQSELVFLAEEIKQKIEAGVDPNEIAVFFRKNKDADEIARIFQKAKIPFKIFAPEDILKNKEIQKMVLLLRAVDNPYNDEILGEVLFIDFLNLDPTAVVKILNRLAIRYGKEEISNKSVYKIISSEKILTELEILEEERKKFLALADFLAKAKREEKNSDFLDFFDYFVNQSGFLKHLISLENNILALARFEKIFNEVKIQEQNKPNYSLKDFLRYLQILEEHNLKIEVGNDKISSGVNLMTAHKSKGLEFEYVYLTNFLQKDWNGKPGGMGIRFFLPTSRAKADLDDERRLFYVALTRAKKEMKISYPRFAEGNEKENEPSQFLKEIEKRLEIVEVPEKDLAEKTVFYFQEKKPEKKSIFDLEFIREQFLKTPLSVSALNNYKKSPIIYFFKNLIKIPAAQGKVMMLGSLIHDALERYFKEKGQREILEIWTETLDKNKIPEKYFAEFEKKGKEILEKYLAARKDSFVFENIELEKKLGRTLELPDGNFLRLTGFADKIEKNGESLTVVDYKTGYNTQQKRNKSKDELHRQLVFYKLLIDEDPKIEGVVEKGVLEFVEELKDKKEIISQQEFLTNEDVAKLKEEIFEFAEDILSGEFLNRDYNRFEFEKENPYDKNLWELWELLRR